MFLLFNLRAVKWNHFVDNGTLRDTKRSKSSWLALLSAHFFCSCSRLKKKDKCNQILAALGLTSANEALEFLH